MSDNIPFDHGRASAFAEMYLFTSLLSQFITQAESRLLTLKTPRKSASENVVCLCRLLNIPANFQTYFCTQANKVDPDQTAPKEQSDLGPHCLQE